MRPIAICPVPAALAATLMLSGCAPATMRVDTMPVACENGPTSAAVTWIEPERARDRAILAAWCGAVGRVHTHRPSPEAPAVALAAVSSSASGTATARTAPARASGNEGGGVVTGNRPLIIVSWNTGVGQGRLVEFVSSLRAAEQDTDLVVLVQEAYRAGEVPAVCTDGTRRATRIRPPPGALPIDEAAAALDMHALYVPSMRNGRDCSELPHEDRGNAILSTLPLDEAAAIELPHAQQRRVAVAATIRSGTRVIRVVSVHFDTWRGRRRQAKGLVDGLRRLPARDAVIIGGDFNQVGFGAGVRHLRRHFTEARCGGGATHAFPAFRLDRLFTSGLDAAVRCTTADDAHGSDHWPLIVRLDPPAKSIPD